MLKETDIVADVRYTIRTSRIWPSGLVEFCVIVKETEKMGVVKMMWLEAFGFCGLLYKIRGLSPRAKYTGRAAAAGRRS